MGWGRGEGKYGENGVNDELAIKFLEQLTRIADSLEKIRQEMDTGNFSYLADLAEIVTVMEGEK